MPTTKPEFLENFFELIESQVQFGDIKSSLLVAGDAILLAVSGGIIKMVSGCPKDVFTVSCMVPSLSLGFATTAAALLLASLVISLRAALPAKIHDQPPPNIFLLSHIAKIDSEKFVEWYSTSSKEELIKEALNSIHGKAKYASKKFRYLKIAIKITILSIGFMFASLVVVIGERVFA